MLTRSWVLYLLSPCHLWSFYLWPHTTASSQDQGAPLIGGRKASAVWFAFFLSALQESESEQAWIMDDTMAWLNTACYLALGLSQSILSLSGLSTFAGLSGFSDFSACKYWNETLNQCKWQPTTSLTYTPQIQSRHKTWCTWVPNAPFGNHESTAPFQHQVSALSALQGPTLWFRAAYHPLVFLVSPPYLPSLSHPSHPSLLYRACRPGQWNRSFADLHSKTPRYPARAWPWQRNVQKNSIWICLVWR